MLTFIASQMFWSEAMHGVVRRAFYGLGCCVACSGVPAGEGANHVATPTARQMLRFFMLAPHLNSFWAGAGAVAATMEEAVTVQEAGRWWRAGERVGLA